MKINIKTFLFLRFVNEKGIKIEVDSNNHFLIYEERTKAKVTGASKPDYFIPSLTLQLKFSTK